MTAATRMRTLSGGYILIGPLIYSVFDMWGVLTVGLLLLGLFVYLRHGGKRRSLTLLLAVAYALAIASAALRPTLPADLVAAEMLGQAAMVVLQINFIPWAVPLMLLVSHWQGPLVQEMPESLFILPQSRFAGIMGAALLGALPAIVVYPYIVASEEIARLASQIVETIYQQPQSARLFEQSGISRDMLAQEIKSLVTLTLQNTPAVEAFAGICLLVTGTVLFALLDRRHAFLRFDQWQLPWYASWGMIVGLVLLSAGDMANLETMRLIGMNTVFFYALTGAVLGLSCLVSLYRSLTLSRRTKTLLLFLSLLAILYLIFFSGLLSVVGGLALVGIIDMALDLRRISKRKGEKPS